MRFYVWGPGFRAGAKLMESRVQITHGKSNGTCPRTGATWGFNDWNGGLGPCHVLL